jgi:hypothetical protein
MELQTTRCKSFLETQEILEIMAPDLTSYMQYGC